MTEVSSLYKSLAWHICSHTLGLRLFRFAEKALRVETVVDPARAAAAVAAPAAAAAVAAASATRGRGGRGAAAAGIRGGRGRGRGGRGGREARPKKTAEDLDAEMEGESRHFLCLPGSRL